MIPQFFDIHTHVNFAAFDEDRDEVVKRALAGGVWMINVGTQKGTSLKAVELANKYKEGVYAIIGLHPIHTGKSYHDKEELGSATVKASDGQAGQTGFVSRGEVFDKNYYKKLAEDKKVVGIGECGLDYYHLDSNFIEKQKQAFIDQIKLANEINKPLMLHIRNGEDNKQGRQAYKDTLELLKTYSKTKGNAHFFAGSWEETKQFLELGFTLSFTGVITFTHDYDEVIRNIPLDMIMSETDAPFVSPVPYRGKRNEPVFVREVVKKIAEIKGENFEKIAFSLIQNARRVFKIDKTS